MTTAQALAQAALKNGQPASETQLALLQLDVTKPCQIRRQTEDYFISREDARMLKTLRKHGCDTSFDVLPSGQTLRFIPVDRVVANTAGRFTVAQIRKISNLPV